MTWQKHNGSFNVRSQLYELIRGPVPKKRCPKFQIGSSIFIFHVESLKKEDKYINRKKIKILFIFL